MPCQGLLVLEETQPECHWPKMKKTSFDNDRSSPNAIKTTTDSTPHEIAVIAKALSSDAPIIACQVWRKRLTMVQRLERSAPSLHHSIYRLSEAGLFSDANNHISWSVEGTLNQMLLCALITSGGFQENPRRITFLCYSTPLREISNIMRH